MISIPELWRIVKCFFVTGPFFSAGRGFLSAGRGWGCGRARAASGVGREHDYFSDWLRPRSRGIGTLASRRSRSRPIAAAMARRRDAAGGDGIGRQRGGGRRAGRSGDRRCAGTSVGRAMPTIDRPETLCVLTSLSSHDRAKRCQKEAWKIFCVNLKKWVAFLRNICYNSLVLNRLRERCAALPGRCGGRKRG